MGRWWNGLHIEFKILRSQDLAGSNPVLPAKQFIMTRMWSGVKYHLVFINRRCPETSLLIFHLLLLKMLNKYTPFMLYSYSGSTSAFQAEDVGPNPSYSSKYRKMEQPVAHLGQSSKPYVSGSNPLQGANF